MTSSYFYVSMFVLNIKPKREKKTMKVKVTDLSSIFPPQTIRVWRWSTVVSVLKKLKCDMSILDSVAIRVNGVRYSDDEGGKPDIVTGCNIHTTPLKGRGVSIFIIPKAGFCQTSDSWLGAQI